ncbi:tryptophan halogenase family protein [Asticcacaulis taihuensis]|uniref:tryptophan halogenase family protein n=1 Tax=Asticcacaulis taihuensis TaxID=260084 RepID=UPI0026F03494|nr:tryptophan halogenase family protein [Asticcacaulis taihuensis]
MSTTQARGADHFVIVGGGTAGWMAAACLARLLLRTPGPQKVSLVESEDIPTIGVGEATVPSIQDMLRYLNIDEADFVDATDATYKLAIRFRDWSGPGSDFFHGFGELGPTIDNLPLFQHWLREKIAGAPVPPLSDLSMSAQLALHNRFAKPTTNGNSPLYMAGYAYHFDAGKVAQYLRGYAEAKGVRRIEGRIIEVTQDDQGDIAGLRLADGREIAGDFFIDCSGFAGLLIGKTLGSDYEDWSHWLPCDRAVAMPTQGLRPIAPYTLVTARAAGWTWRIPLLSRLGNGYVYASRFCDDETARQTLTDAVDSAPVAEPRLLRFTPGRRRHPWLRNCLSLGLASGFLEPLESTSIHLIFANLFRFFDYFPRTVDCATLSQGFNARSVREIEEIRDFLILHYKASPRRDTDFWRYVTGMDIPDSLSAKSEVFRQQGKLFADYYDFFKPASWMAIYDGLGVVPDAADPLAALVPQDKARAILRDVTEGIRQAALTAPTHEAALSALLRRAL